MFQKYLHLDFKEVKQDLIDFFNERCNGNKLSEVP